jgi:mono/diheme cytochrome c family protein
MRSLISMWRWSLVLALAAIAVQVSEAVDRSTPQAGQKPQQGRGARPAPPPGRGGALMGAGPSDLPAVDPAVADRGRKTYASECINCHGTQARGTPTGANLIRSDLVLHDRFGSELGPFLKQGHKMQSGGSSAALTQEQVVGLAHFLRQRVNDTLRGSPIFEPQNILTGDAKAGEAFFNGEGKCSACHSPTGDLAGIGKRFDPVNLQQRFLFPQPAGRGGRAGRGAAPAGKVITVTVTPPSGPPVTGVPVLLDDFNVSLRDESGQYHSWKRTPALKVVKNNPFQAHIDQLERLTDKNMHDVVAYLETLK